MFLLCVFPQSCSLNIINGDDRIHSFKSFLWRFVWRTVNCLRQSAAAEGCTANDHREPQLLFVTNTHREEIWFHSTGKLKFDAHTPTLLEQPDLTRPHPPPTLAHLPSFPPAGPGCCHVGPFQTTNAHKVWGPAIIGPAGSNSDYAAFLLPIRFLVKISLASIFCVF